MSDKTEQPKIKKGDYLIVESAKRCLMKVKEIAGKEISGLNQKMKRGADGQYEKRMTMTVRRRDVLLNLGQSPMPGKVYGVNIEPMYRKIETNTCGTVLFFVDFDDKKIEKTKKALVRTFKKLKKKRLGGLSVEIEIRKAEGKYAGYYHFLPKSGVDVLCIKPNFEMMSDSDLEYVIAHEYAHGIWYRMMRPDNIAKWIALYDKHMLPTRIEEDELKDVYAEMESSGSFREYQRSCDEDTKPVLKAVLKSIRATHGVDRKHLDLLIRHGHSIEEYWPTQVEFTDRGVIVSEYARKSPEEFFAEAFAFWFAGKNLPKEVSKLLVKSLAQLSKGRINAESEEHTDPEPVEE